MQQLYADHKTNQTAVQGGFAAQKLNASHMTDVIEVDVDDEEADQVMLEDSDDY